MEESTLLSVPFLIRTSAKQAQLHRGQKGQEQALIRLIIDGDLNISIDCDLMALQSVPLRFYHPTAKLQTILACSEEHLTIIF